MVPCLIAGLAQTLFAAETNFMVGESAASWMKIGTDARSSAMGGAGRMTTRDINGASSNPANLAGIEGKGQVALMHNILIEDLSLEHVAAGMAFSESMALGLSVDYMNYGSVETYQVSGNSIVQGANQSSSAMSVGGSFAYGMGAAALGATLKYLSESLPGASSNGYALDLGGRWQQDSLSLGLAVQNLMGQLGGSSVGTVAALGGAFSVPAGESLGINLALDFNGPTADFGAYRAGMGLEAVYQNNYSLRAGYSLVGNGGLGGLAAGAGISWNILRVDYAFVMQGDLGANNQISLLAKF
jgi:hypothetical protein